jgi:hypothetical protein
MAPVTVSPAVTTVYTNTRSIDAGKTRVALCRCGRSMDDVKVQFQRLKWSVGDDTLSHVLPADSVALSMATGTWTEIADTTCCA